MKKIYEEGTKLFNETILKLIKNSDSYIRSIGFHPNGNSKISGICLDILPWYPRFGLSLRLSDEARNKNIRISPADWTHFDFTEAIESEIAREAIEFMEDVYNNSERELIDSAHILFLAGANALIQPNIGRLLQSMDVPAPIIEGYPISHIFEYMVLDVDGTIDINYCELLIANQITNRLFK